MDNLTTRRAASSDVERLVELRLLSQEHAETSNPLIWRITEEGKKLLKQQVENDLTDSNIPVLLAEIDGKIMGYVQGEITRRSGHMPRTVGQVSLMYVLKQFRRKGVGRRPRTITSLTFNGDKSSPYSSPFSSDNKATHPIVHNHCMGVSSVDILGIIVLVFPIFFSQSPPFSSGPQNSLGLATDSGGHFQSFLAL